MCCGNNDKTYKPMKYKIEVFNAWQENTVVLYDETGEAALVDCGCFSEQEQERLTAFLRSEGLTPVRLLNTHLHIDHIFGNAFAGREYGLTAEAHRDDLFWVENVEEYARMLGVAGMERPPVPALFLEDDAVIRFGNTELRAIHVPGHSPGSLCYYCEAAGVLVAGDVLFEGSIGRGDLPGGDPEQLIEGIRHKLFVLPDDTVVIPGHGDTTTIGREKRYNPFFR